MSAWRGEARKTSAPKREMSYARRADRRDHLDRAAGQPEAEREEGVARAPSSGLLERRQQHALLDVLLEVVALEVAAQHLLRASAGARGGLGRLRAARGVARLARSLPLERSSPPDVDERDEQQHDEDDHLASAKLPNACSWTAIG